MAVPTSGALSLRGLANEKIDDNYSSGGTPTVISLANLATGTGYDATNTDSTVYPNGTTPHSMSEWYSYDHDTVLGNTSFSASIKGRAGSGVCGLSVNQTYYHNGINALPSVGDYVYTDLSGTTNLSAGSYSFGLSYFTIVNIGGGLVDSISQCPI